MTRTCQVRWSGEVSGVEPKAGVCVCVCGGVSPPDDAALVLLILLHVEVAAVGNGKDVRGQLAHMAVVVQLHLLQGVQGKHLEWVHGH